MKKLAALVLKFIPFGAINGFLGTTFGLRICHATRWKKLLSQADLVIDVGANDGQTVASFRGYGYRGKIVCFEPNPPVFERLRKNMAKEIQAGRMEIYMEALSDQKAVVNFYISKTEQSSGLLLLKDPTNHDGCISLTSRRLDEWKFPAKTIFLKIDAESHDLNVLKGATQLYPQIDYVMMEVAPYPQHTGELPFHQLIAEVESLGFRMAFFEKNQWCNDDIVPSCFDLVFKRI